MNLHVTNAVAALITMVTFLGLFATAGDTFLALSTRTATVFAGLPVITGKAASLFASTKLKRALFPVAFAAGPMTGVLTADGT